MHTMILMFIVSFIDFNENTSLSMTGRSHGLFRKQRAHNSCYLALRVLMSIIKLLKIVDNIFVGVIYVNDNDIV